MDDYTPNRKRTKRGIKAPCAFEEWDDAAQKEVVRYPAAGCATDCQHCGWNPDVAKKRLIKMGYRHAEG